MISLDVGLPDLFASVYASQSLTPLMYLSHSILSPSNGCTLTHSPVSKSVESTRATASTHTRIMVYLSAPLNNGTHAHCHTLQLSPRWMAALKILYEHKDAHQKSRPLVSAPAPQTPAPPVVPVPVQLLPARKTAYLEDESWTATVARAQVSARLFLLLSKLLSHFMCVEL